MPVTADGDRDPTSANDNGSPYGMGHSSGVAGFFAWWREELSALAPKGMRQAFDSHTIGATVQEVDEQIVLKRKPGAAGKVLPADPRKASALAPKGNIIFLLPEDGALRRDRRLPSASRAHRRRYMLGNTSRHGWRDNRGRESALRPRSTPGRNTQFRQPRPR